MKNRRRLMSISALAVMLASLSLFALPRGQAVGELQLIRLKLTAPGGQPIRACVIAGGMVKITDRKAGTEFAYFPAVLDEQRGVVSVKVYRVTGAGGERLEEVETVEPTFKSPKSTEHSPTYSVEVETIGRSASQGAAKVRPVGFNALDDEGGAQCCVTCGDLTVCSNCTVTMSCGSCCTGSKDRPACACGPGGV